ncbi:hypothetical protein MNB_SM-7-1319 [hydrothermal vent metagenome]|uniref:Transglutaminase-like domain-containing protein n=1 Tax=hydrothermal vent metagenome TaxID=652676 RepID=A0A1W1BXJ9_9ZZZZ
MIDNIKDNLHIYVVILAVLLVVSNLAYHFINSNTLFLDDFGAYHKSAKVTKELETFAKDIVSKCDIDDDVCRVQSLLDYVTNIPYKINKFPAHQPLDTIKRNYGDCDDKSNLMISFLKSLNYKSYLVIVPKHAYVIVNIPNDYDGVLDYKKAFYIGDKKFYELETTAKNSKIGFAHNDFPKNIKAIYDPFLNKKVDLDKVVYH